MQLLLVLVAIAVAFHLLRQYWTNRALPQVHATTFDGQLYRTDATTIAVQRPEGRARRTLICMPGFLEDVRYFLSLYEGRGYELILVNNANYHSPFTADEDQPLQWETNPHPVSSIAHDGFIVAQAVRHLATTDDVVLHGHSRGGAVVLDAARQFPDVMQAEGKKVSALLEAPVLPQSTPAGRPQGPVVQSLTRYLMPLFFAASRNISKARLEKLPMMNPTNGRKTGLLKTIFCNTKDYATAIANVVDISEWQRTQPHELYDNYRSITVLVGERDDVLSTKTMTASATEGRARNPGVRIVQTTQTNHFITLERPELVYEALGEAESTAHA